LLSNFPQQFFNFPQWLSNFRQRLSAFRNAFLLFECLSAFRNGFLIILNGFPIFLNGFLLSKKSEKIYLRRQVYKRSLFELHISRHLLSKLCICASMSTSPPTHSFGAPVFPTVHQT
jgi:hypothetical protein